MEFGYDIIVEGNVFACYRNGKQCITGLCKPVEFKSRKAAENYINKQIEHERYRLENIDALRREAQEREARDAAEKAARDAAIDERLHRKREADEARQQRAAANGQLKIRGYRWQNIGFRSEEDADAFDVNLPIGNEWALFSPDGRAVSVQQAMQELASQGVKFAKEWLAERGISEESKADSESSEDAGSSQEIVVSCGKHAGKSVSEVPPSYWRWVASHSNVFKAGNREMIVAIAKKFLDALSIQTSKKVA